MLITLIDWMDFVIDTWLINKMGIEQKHGEYNTKKVIFIEDKTC